MDHEKTEWPGNEGKEPSSTTCNSLQRLLRSVSHEPTSGPERLPHLAFAGPKRPDYTVHPAVSRCLEPTANSVVFVRRDVNERLHENKKRWSTSLTAGRQCREIVPLRIATADLFAPNHFIFRAIASVVRVTITKTTHDDAASSFIARAGRWTTKTTSTGRDRDVVIRRSPAMKRRS